MKSIGFPPGSNNFRLVMIVIVVGFLWVLFLDYTDRISVATEKASIQQTKNIINSSLNIVFATYAVKGQLNQLNKLAGGNPFALMAEYNLLPSNYKGVIKGEKPTDLESGWYYDSWNSVVIYKTYYDDERVYFYKIVLDYDDMNQSGNFEPGIDVFRRLILKIK